MFGSGQGECGPNAERDRGQAETIGVGADAGLAGGMQIVLRAVPALWSLISDP